MKIKEEGQAKPTFRLKSTLRVLFCLAAFRTGSLARTPRLLPSRRPRMGAIINESNNNNDGDDDDNNNNNDNNNNRTTQPYAACQP